MQCAVILNLKLSDMSENFELKYEYKRDICNTFNDSEMINVSKKYFVGTY